MGNRLMMRHAVWFVALGFTMTFGAAPDSSTPDRNRSNPKGAFKAAGQAPLPPENSISYLSEPKPDDPRAIAVDFLHSRKDALKLTHADIESLVVSHRHADSESGMTHLYFQQTLDGIEVSGGIVNVSVDRLGRIIAFGNRAVPNVQNRVKFKNNVLTPVQAATKAAEHLDVTITQPIHERVPVGGVAAVATPDKKVTLSDGGISQEDIPAKLVYHIQPDGGVRLAWDLVIGLTNNEHWWNVQVDAVDGALLAKYDWIQHCNYEVFAIPKENPGEGARTVEMCPQDPTASPFGWHDTNGVAGAEFTLTRGNNVHAYTDRNDDGIPDPGSDPNGGVGLNFSGALVPLNLTMGPETYSNAAVVNLFYWSNILHDVFYLYGFTESAGNFQVNNYGNGGFGNDDLRAEAQDGADIGKRNNANFLTPPDGQRPRMQMFQWNFTIPERDGDLSNSIIAHEFAHGVTVRLTGGPGNVNCLTNNEQMGEGWSDWFGLVLTAKASEVPTTPRGFATYVIGQPANGAGVRPAQYTTDMGVNGYTYGDIPALAIPHGVGFVWASMLWEVYWELVDKHGFNQDIYGDWTTGGNNLALKLVVDALKLQPCGPGFVDGRNAILQADLNLTGGQNQCEIWSGFAKRGLGFSASQGSPGNTADGTEAFDLPVSCLFIGAAPPLRNICAGDSALFTIGVGTSFTPPVTLSAMGNPPPSLVAFSPNPVGSVPNSSDMTISNTGGVGAGNYPITITGTDGMATEGTVVDLNVFDMTPGAPMLQSPADGATGLVLQPTLSWLPGDQALSYVVEIDNDPLFGSIDYSAAEVGTSHVVSINLLPTTTYSWRVRSVNPCGTGATSAAFSFLTGGCSTPNLPIPDVGAGTVSDVITFSGSGILTDLDVSVNILHTWVGDLVVELRHVETGTEIALIHRPGVPTTMFGCNGDNIDAVLDDEAADPVEPVCAGGVPTINGTYRPNDLLGNFDGEDILGSWVLTISDSAGGDIGTLVKWCLSPTTIPPERPEITVDPASLSSTQIPDVQSMKTLTIGNVGEDDLDWNINESHAFWPYREIAQTLSNLNQLDENLIPVSFIVDDGVAENAIGRVGGGQFVWLNRFTPNAADFPFVLDEVWVQLGISTVLVNGNLDLVLHEDIDGDGNPGTGAVHRATYNFTVQVTGATWNQYQLNPPIIFDGPGDILVGVINRYSFTGLPDFPAAIDQTAPQLRSWIGSYLAGNAPNPPTYPADDLWGTIDSFGIVGNWMIRAFGAAGPCAVPVEIPWASFTPTGGTDLPPGSETEVEVTSDSTGLTPGTYQGTLCVNSNDPMRPLVTVPLELNVVDPQRLDNGTKGSLLVFPAIEIKWDDDGNVIQDTFLQITNDYFEDVNIHFLFVNGDDDRPAETCCLPPIVIERMHRGWTKQNFTSVWTGDESSYFSILTGGPKGAPDFANLDDGPEGPGRPDEESGVGRVLRGFALAWAVDAHGHEISWNHLAGNATVIRYDQGAAWEYAAYSLQSPIVAHGEPTDIFSEPGELLLDGGEYEIPFDKLLFDFYTSGSIPFSDMAQVETDLSLLLMHLDLCQNNSGPARTKANFDIWNANEDFFSGTDRCIICWDQFLLNNLSTPNHFPFSQIGTNTGKARIDGVASPTVCGPGTTPIPLLGVSSKLVGFSGGLMQFGVDYTGRTLVGEGKEAGWIRADVIEPPDPLIGGD